MHDWPTSFLKSLSSPVQVLNPVLKPASIASKARSVRVELAKKNPQYSHVKVKTIPGGVELVYSAFVEVSLPSWREGFEKWLEGDELEFSYSGELTAGDRIYLAKKEAEGGVACGFEGGLLVVRV